MSVLILCLRHCTLWHWRIGGRLRSQCKWPNLLVVPVSARCPKHSGAASHWTLPPTAHTKRIPRLLPSDQKPHLPATDQVWITHVIYLLIWIVMFENSQHLHTLSIFYVLYRDKMKNGDYEGIEQIEADLMLMFDNAKRYNMPSSTIYKRAQRLQQIMQVSSLVRNPLQEYPSVSGKWEKRVIFLVEFVF